MAAAKAEKVEKKSQMELARAYLDKTFGKGCIMDLEGAISDTKEGIDGGHPFINYVLGGCVPYGKHIEAFGFESSGKSTWAYTVAGKAQKKKGQFRANGKPFTGRVLILDYEHAFDKRYFKRQGGLTTEDHLIVAQPETAEEGMEILRVFIDAELIDLCIVDSVAAMMSFKESAAFVNSEGKDLQYGTEKQQQGAMGEQQIGLHARVITQSLKQLSGRMGSHGVSIIWINQIRTKIGTGGRQTTETTTGGNAIKFYAAIRLEFRKVGGKEGKILDPFTKTIKKGVVAMNVVVRGAKNKEAAPFKEAPVTVRFGDGLSVEDDLINLAINYKMIEKTGQGWYMTTKLGAARNARGEDDFRKLLREDKVLYKKIFDQIDIEKIIGDAMVVEDDPVADDAIVAAIETPPLPAVVVEEDPEVTALLGEAAPA